MLDAVIPPPRAWTSAGQGIAGGPLTIPEAALAELCDIVVWLRRNPLPTLTLSPREFALPACQVLMAEARARLEDGPGYVILDRLPLDEWGDQEAIAAHWLLASLLARPVAQSWDGKLIYDVADSGRPPAADRRRDVTSAELNFHTDNSYNLCPPRYVALLCMHPALQGGVSGLVSFSAVHNRLREADPAALRRLYAPYLFNRQMEHAPGDAKVIAHPLFTAEGGDLQARLSRGLVLLGYEVAGEAIDAEGLRALEVLERTMEDPAFCRDFVFERGQIQIVHNLRCGHRRTAFEDGPDPARKRRLVRLWLRDEGRRSYHG